MFDEDEIVIVPDPNVMTRDKGGHQSNRSSELWKDSEPLAARDRVGTEDLFPYFARTSYIFDEDEIVIAPVAWPWP